MCLVGKAVRVFYIYCSPGVHIYIGVTHRGSFWHRCGAPSEGCPFVFLCLLRNSLIELFAMSVSMLDDYLLVMGVAGVCFFSSREKRAIVKALVFFLGRGQTQY